MFAGRHLLSRPVTAPSEPRVADDQFPTHATARDDYFAHLLAQPSPLGLGDRVRYDHSTGLWHIWNGVRWAPDKVMEVHDLVRDRLWMWLGDRNINRDADDMKRFQTLMDYSKKIAVLKTLSSMPGIAMSGEEWDTHPELMGFKNGVLNLRTLNLDQSPSPSLHISRSTGFDWDPDADYSPFTDFIEDIMSHDPDTSAYLLRMLGYAMLGTNQEQKFWMWVGGGSNGKGILARTVTLALGDYAYSPPDTLYMRSKFGTAPSNTPRPELLKLQGTRFTYMSEPQGKQFNEELLKAHSGNDPIEARTLYSARYKTFLPTHKIVFLTNEPPRTDDVGPSMQRRVRVIKFLEDYSPTSGRADNTLEGRLQTPAALQGALVAMAVQANHYLQVNAIPEPAQVTTWSQAYIAENDPITSFIQSACVEAVGAEAQGGPLYKAFEGFCAQNGYETLNLNQFGRAMAARFVKKPRSEGSFYLGIRLKNTTDRLDDEK